MNPANRTLKEDVEKWLKPTLIKKNLSNYVINISGNSAKGDNFLGDITFVDVSGTINEDQPKTYSFVIKCGKKSTELRKIMPIRSAFENEIYFYNEVLPVLRTFQEEKCIEDPFDNTPKCFDNLISEDMEVLILENMKISNYSLWNRNHPMDEHHIKLVIKTYAKLHAISFALRDQKPALFKKITENLKDILKIMHENRETPEEHRIYHDLMNLAKERNEHKVVEKLQTLKEAGKTFLNLADPTDPYAVITHGDCWNNNFMFKYQENDSSKLSNVCLLDFQISRLASPVLDLSYFLFCCISEENIQNFDELIELYYSTLSNRLRQLGSDPEKMFPFEELTNQWRKYGKFGLILMPSIIRICVSQKDEVSDLAEAAESGVTLSDAFSYTVKNIREYEKRTIPIMKFAINKGFI